MGRLSTFDDPDIYAAVGEEIATTGRFTLQRLSEATKLSTGSIYHRFSSRERLLAETWLHALRLFQSEFLTALSSGTVHAGEMAALSVPRFCRAHPREAVVLASCRQEQFLGASSPQGLSDERSAINENGEKEIRRFARRIGQPLVTCRLALVAYPYAAVRLFLPEKPVPKSIDAEVRRTYRATIGAD